MKLLRRLYYRLFQRYRRLEMRCVTYDEGDRLIRGNEGKPEKDRWVIAREEDSNTLIGIVYIERRERIRQ